MMEVFHLYNLLGSPTMLLSNPVNIYYLSIYLSIYLFIYNLLGGPTMLLSNPVNINYLSIYLYNLLGGPTMLLSNPVNIYYLSIYLNNLLGGGANMLFSKSTFQPIYLPTYVSIFIYLQFLILIHFKGLMIMSNPIVNSPRNVVHD